MPLDDSTYTPTTFAPGREGLHRLAHILRRKELWPEGFVWDFGDWFCCGYGLGITLWGEERFVKIYSELPLGASSNLFGDGLVNTIKKHKSAVTPEDVADAIERYLAAG